MVVYKSVCKCSLWWTLVLGTSVIQTRPRAPTSARPRPLLTYSLGDVFGGRWQGLKIWSAVSICIYTAGTLWGGLTHSVCTGYTAYNSLSDTGIASPCLLGKEKHFGLLLSNVKVKLCWLCLETECPLKSVRLVVQS